MKPSFLIVGQGLAGTLIHYFLYKKGISSTIINKDRNCASKITSGLMNPLTGRKYVKSWLFDQLADHASRTYQEIGDLLNKDLIVDLPILRALPDKKAELEWDYRSSLKEYTPYMGPDDVTDFSELNPYIKNTVPYVAIKGGYQVKVPLLVEEYARTLGESLRNEDFIYEQLEHHPHGIKYQGESFKGVIFCEGAAAVDNPYFNYLPFNLSKGEAMIGRVPFELKRMVKNKTFLVPWAKDEMWIGSANFWNFTDDQPSLEGQNRMWSQTIKFYNGPFDKLKAMAAIKPSVKDRRPFLGTHPKLKHMHIFNGLGTKGVSLGPFFAEAMVNYLLKNEPLLKEVDIKRFQLK